MTKKAFRKLLDSCSHKDQPLLEIKYQRRVISLIPVPLWYRGHGGHFDYNHKQRIASARGENADARLLVEFQKYNRWLDRWYAENSPGNHLSRQGEHMTQLRASGFTEEQVWEHCVKENP